MFGTLSKLSNFALKIKWCTLWCSELQSSRRKFLLQGFFLGFLLDFCFVFLLEFLKFSQQFLFKVLQTISLILHKEFYMELPLVLFLGISQNISSVTPDISKHFFWNTPRSFLSECFDSWSIVPILLLVLFFKKNFKLFKRYFFCDFPKKFSSNISISLYSFVDISEISQGELSFLFLDSYRKTISLERIISLGDHFGISTIFCCDSSSRPFAWSYSKIPNVGL